MTDEATDHELPIGFERDGRKFRLTVREHREVAGVIYPTPPTNAERADIIVALQANPQLRAAVLDAWGHWETGLQEKLRAAESELTTERKLNEREWKEGGADLAEYLSKHPESVAGRSVRAEALRLLKAAESELAAERARVRELGPLLEMEPFVRAMAKEEGPLPYLRTIRAALVKLDAIRSSQQPAPPPVEQQVELSGNAPAAVQRVMVAAYAKVAEQAVVADPATTDDGASPGEERVSHSRARDLANNQNQPFVGELLRRYIAQQEQAESERDRLRAELQHEREAREVEDNIDAQNHATEYVVAKLNRILDGEKRAGRLGSESLERLAQRLEAAESTSAARLTELQQLYAAFQGSGHSPKNPREAAQAIGQMDEAAGEVELLNMKRQASLDILAEEYPKLGEEWQLCLAFVFGALGADELHRQLMDARDSRPSTAARSGSVGVEAEVVVREFVAERQEQLSRAYDSPLTQAARGYAPQPPAPDSTGGGELDLVSARRHFREADHDFAHDTEAASDAMCASIGHILNHLEAQPKPLTLADVDRRIAELRAEVVAALRKWCALPNDELGWEEAMLKIADTLAEKAEKALSDSEVG